jgi:hypothetical protein
LTSAAKSSITSVSGIQAGRQDISGLKSPAPSGQEKARTTAGSQDATPSTGESQGASASQQSASAIPAVSMANHTDPTAVHSQTQGPVSPAQVAAPLAESNIHSAKMPVDAAAAPAVAQQPLPAINTAKLIQNMGQSEMRVGMRSSEFGSISISTSSTRSMISAQISLDHSELAKAIAVHLPEMQARLGGSQGLDVRIDMNGQGTGTSGGTQNGSAGESHGKQQAGSVNTGHAGNGVAGRGFAPTVSAVAAGDGIANTRLDIRV